MVEATLLVVRNFFGMSMAEFKAEWPKLTTEDKAQIRKGLTDGSLNY